MCYQAGSDTLRIVYVLSIFTILATKTGALINLLSSDVNQHRVLYAGTIDSHPQVGANVWATFASVAAETKAFNLGQGFPDWDPPNFMREALVKAAHTSFHQYTRPAGHLPLVELIAKRYSNHLNRNIDHINEVAITVGASQGLYLALMTLLRTGDEVVMFEPFFELYQKQIKLTGATAKYVPLGISINNQESRDPWSVDVDTLRR